MANPERGQADFTVGGKQYTLVFDQHAVRSLEAELSTDKKDAVFNEILRAAERGQYRAVSGLLWASLQRHHPDMTMDRVDELISDAGGMKELNSALMLSLKNSRPTKKDLDDSGVSAKRPRKA